MLRGVRILLKRSCSFSNGRAGMNDAVGSMKAGWLGIRLQWTAGNPRRATTVKSGCGRSRIFHHCMNAQLCKMVEFDLRHSRLLQMLFLHGYFKHNVDCCIEWCSFHCTLPCICHLESIPSSPGVSLVPSSGCTAYVGQVTNSFL